MYMYVKYTVRTAVSNVNKYRNNTDIIVIVSALNEQLYILL